MAIQQFIFENFGPLAKIQACELGPINLMLGNNSTGKTYLLKALYAIIRAHEEAGRGDDPRDFDKVLSDKFYWTFQPDSLGDLVRRGSGNRLKASFTMENDTSVAFEYGKDTTKKIKSLYNNPVPRRANSVFLPPKEVLSLAWIILKSGLHDKVFGFDATYVDLVLALQGPVHRGLNHDAFKESRTRLEKMFHGRIEFDSSDERWVYRKGNSKFSIHNTAEGIKKIAILDTLLGNRYLSPESIVFIDEPESALHPVAITQLLEIIAILAQCGIQFFLASHSYFVVKKLYLLARRKDIPIPVFIADTDGNWQQSPLADGIPENEIVNESVRLFDEELKVSLA